MKNFPKYQIAKGIRPKRKQEYKAGLLAERFPGTDFSGLSEQLYQVDTRSPSQTVIRMRDCGWLEVEGRRIRTYGPKGQAAELARRLLDADYADNTEHLEEIASYQRKGSGLRQRRGYLPEQPLSAVERRAEWWMAQGFTEVSPQPDGVWVRIGHTRIQDTGDELRIHGKPSDDAMRVMVLKAVEVWGAEMEVFGSREFKNAAWLEAQRQGVSVFDADTGEAYEPSPDIKKQWESDIAKSAADTAEIDGIRTAKKLSTLLKSAAAGDAEAAARLGNHDPDLHDFLSYHLDADQREAFAQEPDEKVIPALADFRDFGRMARKDEDEKPEEERRKDLAERLAIEEAAREAREKRDRSLAPS